MGSLSPLIWGLILVTLLSAAAWLPRYGLLARWRARRLVSQRQVLEDALKAIFDLQQEGQPAGVSRLAADLKLSPPAAEALAARMEAQGLVQAGQGGLALTPSGRHWALQVVRAHRLWERYLADEARMPLEQVHLAADQREHRLTAAEIESLDAALGYPARDPHGDPIPNAAGVLREAQPSTPLAGLKPGQYGRIAHLEDEPPLAYAQLLAEGLYVGQSIALQESSPERVVLSSGDSLYTLAPSIAGNVFVQLETPPPPPDPALTTLDALKPRARAEIVGIDARCQGFTRRRLLDLGLTPGTAISAELENAFRDPRAYRVRGSLFALRRDQASLIRVRLTPPEPASPQAS